jgi:hypothetical protein
MVKSEILTTRFRHAIIIPLISYSCAVLYKKVVREQA